MNLQMILLFCGGLGMFLYGMHMMSAGMERIAGDKLRDFLEKITNNRFAGIAAGAGITCLIQSSSATTVMLISFVNAGLMTLTQATGALMGANIGTTITAQLIAFKLTDVASIFLLGGVVMIMFFKKRSITRIGEICAGFGVLFLGMMLMTQAMEPLRSDVTFLNMMTSLSNPVLGVLVGMLFTCVIQSSSATIGILQALAMQNLIGLDAAVFIVLGSNLGTCITGVLASLSANANAKRTAFMNVIINGLGVLIFIPILLIFPDLVDWIASWSPSDSARQIANFHLSFNIITVGILVGFIPYMVKLVYKIMPQKFDEEQDERRLKHVTEMALDSPAVATQLVVEEIARMYKMSVKSVKQSIQSFYERDEKKADKVVQREKTINYLNTEITRYLVRLSSRTLTKRDHNIVGKMYHVVSDIERVGDHAENIAEFTLMTIEDKIKFSKPALEEMQQMTTLVVDSLKLSLDMFEMQNPAPFDKLCDMEQKVDDLRILMREDHVVRLKEGQCDASAGLIYNDLLGELERLADHARDIAKSVVE